MADDHGHDRSGGGTAALLTTLAFVPQVVKTLTTRHTRDISLGIWVPFSAGGGVVAGLWADAERMVALSVTVTNRGKE